MTPKVAYLNIAIPADIKSKVKVLAAESVVSIPRFVTMLLAEALKAREGARK